MVNSEYWDESEYNFFKDLDDVDKLLYVYDLMLGDFADEDKSVLFEPDDDSYDDASEDGEIRQNVFLSIDDKSVLLFGENLTVLQSVISNLFLNGFILSNKKQDEFLRDEKTFYRLEYTLVGNSNPISVN